jgi:hypothetical protein
MLTFYETIIYISLISLYGTQRAGSKKGLPCLQSLPRQQKATAFGRGSRMHLLTGMFPRRGVVQGPWGLPAGLHRPDDWATMALNQTSQKGLKNGWTRATFILRKDYLEKLKSLSYWERKKIKEVIDEALGSYLEGKRIRKKTSR